MVKTQNKTLQQSAFQLKGSLFALTVMQLQTENLQDITEQLDHMIQKTPKFFQHMPIVIDFKNLNRQLDSYDFVKLKQVLFAHNIIPVGIRGGNTKINQQALEAGLAILLTNQHEEHKTETKPASNIATASDTVSLPVASNPSKVITKPVRSGQQVYAKGGDLIVLAAVSHGAELLADGHIHVYGPLRGRALAGVGGDETARIFCRGFEAELISIAGNYILNEDLERAKQQNANEFTQIYLTAGRLHIELLS